MELANNSRDSRFKMEKDEKKKKGRLRRGLKKVLNCFLSCGSSNSKESSEDDVYELTTSKTQTTSTPSSIETQTFSESSATKIQKTKKPGFMARLKAKMSRSQIKRSCETDSTLPASTKTPAVLGGATMRLGNENSYCSDDVSLPPKEKNRDILEGKRILQLTSDFSVASQRFCMIFNICHALLFRREEACIF